MKASLTEQLFTCADYSLEISNVCQYCTVYIISNSMYWSNLLNGYKYVTGDNFLICLKYMQNNNY